MSDDSTQRPETPPRFDEIPMRVIVGVVALAAVAFGALNYVGDIALFNTDTSTSDVFWDAAWHGLLFFIGLSLWAAFDRWRAVRARSRGANEDP
jgi:hypothetical protein